MPQVSLVMAVYNREKYIEDAIGSILGQTMGDWELVVWDDGSEDASVEIARQYKQRDKRIRVVCGGHVGAAESLKRAIAMTTAPFIGWVDSDDMLGPTALEDTLGSLVSMPDIGAVYTDYLLMSEDGELGPLGSRCSIPYSKDRLLVDFMTFHFRLIRRSVFERAGGIRSVPFAEDYDLCLRLSEVADFAKVSKPLYYYRQHEGSISAAHQMEQIQAAQEAVNRALERRGLSKRYELCVELIGRFYLRPKPCSGGSD